MVFFSSLDVLMHDIMDDVGHPKMSCKCEWLIAVQTIETLGARQHFVFNNQLD